MGSKTILVSYGVRFDAAAGPARAERPGGSPLQMSRSMFTAEVGAPRLLTLFERFGIRATWFLSSHCIECFPDQSGMVVEAGHEVAACGHAHESPASMTRAQEERMLAHSLELIAKLSGSHPRGHAAAGGALTPVTADLLRSRGIVYDHSLMRDDIHPYYLRTEDLHGHADATDKGAPPPVKDTGTALIEIPVNEQLDDMARTRVLEDARRLEAIRRDTFDWVYRECDYAVLPMSLHPDESGRPQALLMHERLFEHMSAHPGVRFVTMSEVAAEFARRNPHEI